jgi:hypothetical protein
MHVDARSQRPSESGRRDSRRFCAAAGSPADPRAQSEKASRRIMVMRRLCRPANPRVIRRRRYLARSLTLGIDAEERTHAWPPPRREIDRSLHPRIYSVMIRVVREMRPVLVRIEGRDRDLARQMGGASAASLELPRRALRLPRREDGVVANRGP